ncbi:MAG TPA: hypothetical protein VNE63_20680 [Candidatus Acidoferrales bacterium]|nr:hypothetical protein [Candidatus Acidoferrales bacterium]
MQWSADFIDLPEITNQKQPVVTAEEAQSIVQDGPDATLYLLLATSGLRISEALNLRREDYHGGAVRVVQGKTTNAVRVVDLAPQASEIIVRVADETTHLTTLRERIKVPGFHSLRRFRESVLQRSECRNLLINFWMGHSDKEISTRYGKQQLLADVAFRKSWAEKVGLGFDPTVRSFRPREFDCDFSDREARA